MKCRCIVPHAYEIRIERAWWMRMLPFSAAYYCTHCQVKSLQFGRRRVRRAGTESAPASRH
jgi:hypothetical protein